MVQIKTTAPPCKHADCRNRAKGSFCWTNISCKSNSPLPASSAGRSTARTPSRNSGLVGSCSTRSLNKFLPEDPIFIVHKIHATDLRHVPAIAGRYPEQTKSRAISGLTTDGERCAQIITDIEARLTCHSRRGCPTYSSVPRTGGVPKSLRWPIDRYTEIPR
jgi:hypothetical protein